MIKKEILAFSLGLLFILMISGVNAAISISQPNSLYSFGEELSLKVTLDSLGDGYMDMLLVCSNGEANIYHNVPEAKEINVKRTLSPTYIKDLEGNCHISLSYNGKSSTSQNFQVSRKLDINLAIAEFTLAAGETLNVKGNLKRSSNQIPQKANVEAVLNSDIKKTAFSENGEFSFDFSIPENLKAGVYELKINALEKDSKDNILNSGVAIGKVSVNQKPGKIEIALNKQGTNPGEELEIIPILYDKAGDILDVQLLLTITNSKESEVYKGLVKSNEKFILKTAKDMAFGLANIKAEKEDIIQEKEFEVFKKAMISAEIQNGTLRIKNIGNTNYERIVEIQIDGVGFPKSLNLSVGEIREFELNAPDGEHEIVIKDEESEVLTGKAPLTGNVISVEEARERISAFFINYPIVWVFIIIVFAILIYVLIKKNKEKKLNSGLFDKSRAKAMTKNGGVYVVSKEEIKKSEKGLVSEKKNNFVEDKKGKEDKIELREVRRAEQVLVMHGKSQKTAIIAIKIKNNRSSAANKTIEKVLERAYSYKAVSYSSGNYILLLLSPLVTKKEKNEENAIKLAQYIDNEFRNHNKLFRDLIDYGIGLNSGGIVSALEEGVLKFTSIDKTIKIARRIAELSNQEVLLSKEIHLASSAGVKVDKNEQSKDIETFRVKRVINTEESRKFISDFLKRN